MYFSFYHQNHIVPGKDSSMIAYKELFQGVQSCPNPMLPDMKTSGTLTCLAPLTGKMEPLPYYGLLYITEGEAGFSIDTSPDLLVFDSGKAADKTVTSHTESAQEPIFLHENTLLFLPPRCAMEFLVKAVPFSCTFYFLSGTVLDPYAARLMPTQLYHSDVGLHLKNNLHQLDRLLQHTVPDSPFFLTQCILNLLTQCISLHTGPIHAAYPAHVLFMKEIFDQEYVQNHTLSQLEKRLQVNKYQLCRDFSQNIGCSPLQYLNQVRIHHAKQLLWQTDLTVHAVGIAVGIPNTSHFIRLFQRETGLTPLKYRSQRPFSPVS